MKTVIFDMDGVLLDSELIYLNALKKYLATLNVEASIEELSVVVGMKIEAITQYLKEKYVLTATMEELIKGQDVYFAEEERQTELKPMDGLLEYLKFLKDKRINIALASSSDLNWINRVLDALDIRKYFDVICSGEEVKYSKPHPEIFLLAAKRIESKPEECIVIEDSVNGIKAGKEAGMFVIGYKGSKITQDTSNAHREIYSFHELIE